MARQSLRGACLCRRPCLKNCGAPPAFKGRCCASFRPLTALALFIELFEIPVAGFGADEGNQYRRDGNGPREDQPRRGERRHEGQHGHDLGRDAAGLAAGGDEARAPSADIERIAFRRIGQQHGDHAVGARQQQRKDKLGRQVQRRHARAEQREAEQTRRGDEGRQHKRAFRAPAAVEPGGDGAGRQRPEAGIEEDFARLADVIARGFQVGGRPEQHAEIHEPPGQRRKVEREGAVEQRRPQQRARAVGRKIVMARRHRRIGDGGAEARHDRQRFLPPTVHEQESRRFRNEAVEKDQQQPRWQADEPEHAPAVKRLEQMRQSAGGEIAADEADAAEQHEGPAAVPRRDRLRHQRIGDGQHAARRKPHGETHGEVPAEGRHRAADGGADEHDRGKQDGGPAAEPVRQHAPDPGAERRAGEARKRQPGDDRLGDAIFLHGARHDEAERRGLHGVDDEGGHKHQQQLPVRGFQPAIARFVDRADIQVPRLPEICRQQPIGRKRRAKHNRRHAPDHLRTHRHARHAEAVGRGIEEHGDMRQHAKSDGGRAEPEGQKAVAVRGGKDGVGQRTLP